MKINNSPGVWKGHHDKRVKLAIRMCKELAGFEPFSIFVFSKRIHAHIKINEYFTIQMVIYLSSVKMRINLFFSGINYSEIQRETYREKADIIMEKVNNKTSSNLYFSNF